MKLAFFSNSYLPYLSGITLSIKTLKDELRALGHTVFIVGPKYPGYIEPDPQILRLLSFPATYPGYRFVFPYSYQIFAKLRKEKINLIHAHQPFGVGLAALLLAKRMKIPLVYSFHTLFSRYVHHAPFVPPRLAKQVVASYLTFFCQQAATVIVPSEMVRRWLVLRKVKSPIKIIPSGINLSAIKEKKGIGEQRKGIRERHGLPPDSKILLFSGRMSKEKNILFLLKVFPRISAQEKNAFFLLVGGGPKEKEYRQLAQSLSRQIIFVGQKKPSEVLDYCLAADVFIYASMSETQGLVITEAKACGLPVVAIFSGGVPDIVESGVDGYLVPNNQEKFAEHVLRLLKDDKLRKEMSIKAEEDAQSRFSSVVVAKKMESVYNSLINK